MNLYQLFDKSQAETILSTLKEMEWSEGRARTKEATGTIKQNLEILPDDNDTAYQLLLEIDKTLNENLDIQLNHAPLKTHPPKFNKYLDGGQYKTHTDAPWMGITRTDLSCTIFLSDPDSYEGGELCINGQAIKGKAGECFIYECGTPHSVNPVTSGERICANTWIQSRIRDPHKRKLVTDLRKLLHKIEPDHRDWFLEGASIHSALFRMWME